MKKTLCILATVLFSTTSFASEKSVLGMRFYDKQSDKLTNLVKELSAEYKIGATKYKSLRNSDVTKYKVFTFSKELGATRVIALRDGNESSIYEKLDSKYASLVDSLMEDMEREAHHIDSYRTGFSYERGGVSYGARNLPEIKSISLVCKTEIFSDNSGGNRCFTRAENIDISNREIVLVRHSANGTDEVDSLPWGSDAFKATKEHKNLAIELFKRN